jgi:SAM-dependent methyltransferase
MIMDALQRVNGALRTVSRATHFLQYKAGGLVGGDAEWFPHYLDLYWQLPARQRPMFLERGVFNLLAMKPGARVLDMCCGDGFYSDLFYSSRAAHVLAVDHNRHALRHARRCHSRSNVEYRQADIRDGVPAGPFDNIVWDSALHHFTTAEVRRILAALRTALVDGGVLSGFTEIEPPGYSYARLHFEEPEELAQLLKTAFANVAIVETPDSERRCLHFFASDSPQVLPFAEGIHQPACGASGTALCSSARMPASPHRADRPLRG